MYRAIKILLLLLAAGAILYSIYTHQDAIEHTPDEVTYSNAHLKDIEARIKKFPETANKKVLENTFFEIADKIESCLTEKHITSTERDEQMEELVRAYLPAFYRACKQDFADCSLTNENVRWMRKNINQLIALRVMNNSQKLVGNSWIVKLNALHRSANRYLEAKERLKNISFTSINQAKQLIAEAEDYLQDENLKQCGELVAQLSTVKEKLHQQHFNKLEALPSRLKRYRSTSQTNFEAIFSECLNLLNDYQRNAQAMYGYKKDIEVIRTRCRTNYWEGYDYYQTQKLGATHASTTPNQEGVSNRHTITISNVITAGNRTIVTFKVNIQENTWLSVKNDTHLKATGCTTPFYLASATNIKRYPEKNYYTSKRYSTFTLFFPALPKGTRFFDIKLKMMDGYSCEFIGVKVP